MHKVATIKDFSSLDSCQSMQLYNGLDSAVTLEILPKLKEMLDPHSQLIYNFSRGLQAPTMAMSYTGVLVDENIRSKLEKKARDSIDLAYSRLQLFAQALGQHELNPRSHKQLTTFFYQFLKLPVQYKYNSSTKKNSPSCDETALNNLAVYTIALPFIKLILAFRHHAKLLESITEKIDPDNVFRPGFNVVGTVTGRLSSSENARGTAGNGQNKTAYVRQMYVARPGYKFAYIDLEQAESRVVAYISGDKNYIQACESGDLHTEVTRMCYPNMGWNGDLAHDRYEIAGQEFHNGKTYRDGSKTLGHGSNYGGKPETMANHSHIPVYIVAPFQKRYFEQFPGIPLFHKRVSNDLESTRTLISPTGRKRNFWDRVDSPKVLNEAIANDPQGTIGDLLNVGLYRLWDLWWNSNQWGRKRILLQVHDALLIEYKEEDEEEALAEAAQMLDVALTIGENTFSIPIEIETGWNWYYYSEKNPDGVKKHKASDKRKRTHAPQTSVLDQCI